MGMKKLRIYIENSVIGGYFDDEFKDILKNCLEISKMRNIYQ